MAGEATSAAGGGPSLRTRSGLITKGYCELGVEDPEENFVAVLPKVLPNPIGQKKTLPKPICKKKTPPDPIGMKGAIIMRIKDGYGGKTSIP